MPNESLQHEREYPTLHSTAANSAIISLPSAMCFCVPAEKSGASSRDLQTLAYGLEEELPLDAEHMATHVGRRLIIAADGHAVNEWYAGQEHGTQTCIAAVPRAVLIAQGAISYVDPSPRYCFIIVSGQHADVLTVCDGEVVAWLWTSSGAETLSAVAATLVEDDLASSKLVVIGDSQEAKRSNWPERFKAAATWLDAPSAELEGLAASRILDGTSVPLVNLANGPLAFVDPLAPIRPGMKLLVATAALATVLVCAALNWRASQYRAEVVELGTRQEAIFRELFPKQDLPVGILSRIESEHRRLAAMKGAGSNIPEIGSSLPVMRSFWQAVPTDARFSLEILDFAPNNLKYVDGSAKSYADLESVRLALIAHEFAVPALSATQTSRGVSLRVADVHHGIESPAKASTSRQIKP